MTQGAASFSAADATDRAARRAADAAGELDALPTAHERTKRGLRSLSTELAQVAALLRDAAR